MAKAEELARSLLELPADALAEAKKLLSEENDTGVTDRTATESFGRCLQLDDARKSIARFTKE